MKTYTIIKDEYAYRTWWGEFTERNVKDERVTFAICENLGFGGKPNWYCAEVWVYNNKGECYGDYNPCFKPADDGRRWVADMDWILEATDENRERLIGEIERRAFGL